MPYIFKVGNRKIKIPKFEELTWSKISNKPSGYPPSSHFHTFDSITGKPSTYPPSSHSHNYASSTHTHSLLEDTGWINCTYASGFIRYSSNQSPLQVRRIGKTVHLRGAVKKIGSTTPSNDNSTKLGILPNGFLPTYGEVFICQGSGSNKFMLNIANDGNIYLSRYSNTTSINQPIPDGTWLNCYATWFID